MIKLDKRDIEILKVLSQDGRITKAALPGRVTGSAPVGKLLYRQSADTVKRLVASLHSHDPRREGARRGMEKLMEIKYVCRDRA